nr:hypothetical protein [Pedobacter sp. ASV2]
MKTGAEILEVYQKQRDFSGSEMDSYAQDLYGYYFHAQMQGKADLFYKLLEKAELENKKIVFVEPSEDILYDDYPLEDLILVDK